MKNFIRKIRKVTPFVVAFTSATALAQQTPLFNTYSYDLLQMNIAAIGRTCLEADLNYRAQWLGVKETPRLYQLNVGMAMGESNGIGAKIFQQNQGLIKVTNFTGAYAYRMKLNETSKLHFGIGAAWSQNSFDVPKTKVMDANDPTLSNNQQQRSNNLDCEAGVLFLSDKMTAGLSALHLYNTNTKLEQVTYKVKPELNFMFAYKFNKGKQVEVEPWLVNRYTVGGANKPEGMVNVKFLQRFTVGAGYRVNYGVIGLAGFELGKLRVAYSFDYGTGERATSLGSSHQIMIGFDLCKKKIKNTPDSSAQPPVAVTEPAKQIEEPKKAEPVLENPVKEEPPAPVVETKPVVEPTPEPVVINEPVKAEEPVKSAEPVKAAEPEKLPAKKNEKPVQTPITPEELNPIAIQIVFEKNSYAISPENEAKLKEAARIINSGIGNVTIVGYASPEGELAHNLDLAIHRAEAVKRALIRDGVKASRLKVKNGGSTNELNPTLEGNRTVRFE